MTFVGGYTGMKVKRASVGGEGLVLDHFRREALELHLKHNGDVQKPYLRGAKTIFMDSWEVFGSNWTPRLPEEFARRRGYSLIPYLAALFLPTGDSGARVRYDFRKTLSELALENFYAPLNQWAHQNGFQTRVQAHGTPADIIEAYGLNDFPEAKPTVKKTGGGSTFATGSWRVQPHTFSGAIQSLPRVLPGCAVRRSSLRWKT